MGGVLGEDLPVRKNPVVLPERGSVLSHTSTAEGCRVEITGLGEQGCPLMEGKPCIEELPQYKGDAKKDWDVKRGPASRVRATCREV